jgi:hypothetical protein
MSGVFPNRRVKFNDDRDCHGYLDLIDDHLPERSLSNAWSIPET